MIEQIAAHKVISVYWWHWAAILLCCALPLRTPSVRITAWLYSSAFFCAQFAIWYKDLSGQTMFLFAACAELVICGLTFWQRNRAAYWVSSLSLVAAAFHLGIAAQYSWPNWFDLFRFRGVISGVEWGQIAAIVIFSGPVYNSQLAKQIQKARDKESVWTAFLALR